MAKQLNIDLNIRANSTSAKASLDQLKTSLTQIQSASANLISPTGLQAAQSAAKDLEMHLSKAVNVNTGKLDLSKFSASLKASNQSLSTLSKDLLRSGQLGQQAFNSLTQSIASASNASIGLSSRLNGILATIKNTARWQLSSSILHGFMTTVQGAYNYVEKLNKSLTDIQIVTESSSEKMATFAKEANKAAQALSTTTNNYAKAALIFYQQGRQVKIFVDKVG